MKSKMIKTKPNQEKIHIKGKKIKRNLITKNISLLENSTKKYFSNEKGVNKCQIYVIKKKICFIEVIIENTDIIEEYPKHIILREH